MTQPKMIQISFSDAAMLRAEGLKPYTDTGRMWFVRKGSPEHERLKVCGHASAEELALEREIILDSNNLMAETRRRKKP